MGSAGPQNVDSDGNFVPPLGMEVLATPPQPMSLEHVKRQQMRVAVKWQFGDKQETHGWELGDLTDYEKAGPHKNQFTIEYEDTTVNWWPVPPASDYGSTHDKEWVMIKPGKDAQNIVKLNKLTSQYSGIFRGIPEEMHKRMCGLDFDNWADVKETLQCNARTLNTIKSIVQKAVIPEGHSRLIFDESSGAPQMWHLDGMVDVEPSSGMVPPCVCCMYICCVHMYKH